MERDICFWSWTSINSTSGSSVANKLKFTISEHIVRERSVLTELYRRIHSVSLVEAAVDLLMSREKALIRKKLQKSGKENEVS